MTVVALRSVLMLVAGLLAVFLGLNGLGLGAMAALRASFGAPAGEGPAALLPGLLPNLGLSLAGYAGLRVGLHLIFRGITRGYRDL